MTKKKNATGKACGMSRRYLLASVPAMALVPTASTAVATVGQDKHVQWLADFYAAQRVWEAAEEETPREELLFERWHDIQRKFCRTPATSLEGLAAQAAWLVEDVDGDWACEDHRCLAVNMAAGLRDLMEERA